MVRLHKEITNFAHVTPRRLYRQQQHTHREKERYDRSVYSPDTTTVSVRVFCPSVCVCALLARRRASALNSVVSLYVHTQDRRRTLVGQMDWDERASHPRSMCVCRSYTRTHTRSVYKEVGGSI